MSYISFAYFVSGRLHVSWIILFRNIAEVRGRVAASVGGDGRRRGGQMHCRVSFPAVRANRRGGRRGSSGKNKKRRQLRVRGAISASILRIACGIPEFIL